MKFVMLTCYGRETLVVITLEVDIWYMGLSQRKLSAAEFVKKIGTETWAGRLFLCFSVQRNPHGHGFLLWHKRRDTKMIAISLCKNFRSGGRLRILLGNWPTCCFQKRKRGE